MLRLAVLLSICVGLSPCIAVAKPVTESGWHDAVIQHDGVERHFRYYVPHGLSANAPTVIVLHGGKQSMTKIFHRRSGATKDWPVLAEKEKFLLLVPNGVNVRSGRPDSNSQNWNDCRVPVEHTGAGSKADDVGFIRAMIERATSRFELDTTRIYVTGASNGGMMSYRLAAELSDKIAAIAVFVANHPADSDCAAPVRPVPVMIVNGTADPLMPWSGGEIGGGGGSVLSAEDTLGYWLKTNNADKSRAKTHLLPNTSQKDKSTVTKTVYPATQDGAAVWFYRVKGGGHTMPSREHVVPRWIRVSLVGNQNMDFDSVREAWSFLAMQRLLE